MLIRSGADFLGALSKSLIEICIGFALFSVRKWDDCQDGSPCLTCENKSCMRGLQCHFFKNKFDIFNGGASFVIESHEGVR